MKKQGQKRVGEEAKVIGRNLARIRVQQGATQRQVAKALQTSFQQIQKYEKGANRIPAERLHRLKSYFDVPYDTFFEGLDSQSAQEPFPFNPEKCAAVISARFLSLRDPESQQKLYRAFLLLVS